jgi:hypothetical protein
VLVELLTHLLDASGEAIADPLELAHREQARAAEPGNAEVDPLAGEGGAEEPRQSQLHRRDLPTKVGSGRALVALA